MELPPNLRGIAVPWFTAETWPRLLEIADDREQLFDTFEEWRDVAEARLAELRDHGVPIERMVVDPDDILDWCQARGRKVDAEARSEFAAFQLAKMHGEDP